MNVNDTQLIWIVGAAVAVIVVAVVASLLAARRAKRRHVLLKQRFGPEYERTVRELGPRKGEHELAERVRHVERIRVRELSEDERARFGAEWTSVQALFVDDPVTAVTRANDLIKRVMQARGYPRNEEFDRRVADLSVDHPEVVQHYRAAHALAREGTERGGDTEDLRQAVVHYRVIFADLLATGHRRERTTPVMQGQRYSHA